MARPRNHKAEYTKHYYIGSQRILSKIGDVTTYDNEEPTRTAKAGFGVDEADNPNYEMLLTKANELEKAKHDSLGVEYLAPTPLQLVYNNGSKKETQLYFYHPDHLGSSSFVSFTDGEIAQHTEYVPFGEVLLDETNRSWATPWLFNGKELDEESGYYYYGARYYNPKISNWLSVDPLWEKVGPNRSPYEYTYSNPINFIDPTGMSPEGDFHDRKGNYLGNDGNEDGKIYLLNSGMRPKLENEDVNWGGTLSDVHSENLKNNSTEVGGLIIQDRIEEGKDFTISEFKTVGSEKNVSGYILEPGGPSTTTPNQDKRKSKRK